MISNEDIKKLTELARIDVPESEIEGLFISTGGKQTKSIFIYIKLCNMLNTNLLQKLQQDAVVSLYSLIIFVLMNS